MEYFLSILLIGFAFFCLKVAAHFIDSLISKKKKKVSVQESEQKKTEFSYHILLETEHDIFVGGDKLDLAHIKKALEDIGQTNKYIVFVEGEDYIENEYAHCENGEIKFESNKYI